MAEKPIIVVNRGFGLNGYNTAKNITDIRTHRVIVVPKKMQKLKFCIRNTVLYIVHVFVKQRIWIIRTYFGSLVYRNNNNNNNTLLKHSRFCCIGEGVYMRKI